jgi:hypothetical protein
VLAERKGVDNVAESDEEGTLIYCFFTQKRNTLQRAI